MPTDRELEAAEGAIIALYITCDSYALEMAKAALEAAEKVRAEAAPTQKELQKEIEKLTHENDRYERKKDDAGKVYACLFRDFTTLTELLNKNIKREEDLREALKKTVRRTMKKYVSYTVQLKHIKKIAKQALQKED